MTRHLDDQLDAWLDGELSPADRTGAERHLGECAECREAAARLRALRDTAAALPREIAPARDLWPGIAARLNEPAVVPFPARRGPGRPLALAAAAAVLMALSSALTLVAVRRPTATPAEAVPAALVLRTAAVDPPALDVEGDYERAATELVAALNARGAALSPETRAAVSRGLTQIDDALAEIRGALSKDPASGELMRLLTGTHKRRVEMLRRVARLSRT
jgi:anti-sigma factor RsiW